MDRLGRLPSHTWLHVPATLGIGQDREIETILKRWRRLLQRQRERIESTRLPLRRLSRGVVHSSQVPTKQIASRLMEPLRYKVCSRKGTTELVILLQNECELILILLDVITQRRIGESLVWRVRELKPPNQLIEQRILLA
ncbi:hypothetical protein X551_04698 [Methylibium sp. T29]|nr:hypothetical protein X551_04698 [Methylibium sp. T29]